MFETDMAFDVTDYLAELPILPEDELTVPTHYYGDSHNG